MNRNRFRGPSGRYLWTSKTMGLAMSSITSSKNGAIAMPKNVSTRGV